MSIDRRLSLVLLLSATGCFTPTSIEAPSDAGRDASRTLDASAPEPGRDATPGVDAGAIGDASAQTSDASAEPDATWGPDSSFFDAATVADAAFAPDASSRADSSFADAATLPDAALAPDAASAGPDASAERDAGFADAATSSVCYREESGPCLERACDSNGWCWEHPLPRALSLWAVHGSSETNVWAVGTIGRGGGALQFDGKDWIGHRTGFSDPLVGVWAGSPTDVWAIRTLEVVHWDGQSWSSKPLASGLVLRALWGTSTDDLWVAGPDVLAATKRCRAFHWDGNLWTETPLPATGEVWTIRGSARNDVWMVGGDLTTGGSGRIFHWDGTAWSESFSEPNTFFWDVLAVSASEAYALDSTGIVKWDGTSWARMPGAMSDLWRLTISDGHLVALTSYGFSFTYDGTGWSYASGPGLVQLAVWPQVEPKVAVGGGGVLLRQSSQWTLALPAQSMTRMPIASAWGAAATDLWAFPSAEPALHWDGAAWSRSAAPTGLADTLSSGTSYSDVWALGRSSSDGFALAHFDGTGWTSLLPPTSESGASLNALWAAAPGDVWIAGHAPSGTGAVWRGDGTTWTAMSLPVAADLSGIWGTSASDVWVAAQTQMLHYDGKAWTAFALGSSKTLQVAGTRSSDVRVITEELVNGGISRYLQRWNGSQWSLDTTNTFTGLCTLGNETWATIADGAVMHWDGAAWTQLTVDASSLLGCWVTPDRVVRVYGFDGAILSRKY